MIADWVAVYVSYNLRNLCNLWISLMAVFSPMPGTPGMLSTASPSSPSRSAIIAGGSTLRDGLFLQAAWNRRGMQNLGFAYAIDPALRRLYADPARRTAALRRHLPGAGSRKSA